MNVWSRMGSAKNFLGDHQPPATHYRLGSAKSGFYAEFLTPLIGSRYDRKGTVKATGRVAGVASQKLRHLDLLLDMPWHVEIDKAKGFPANRIQTSADSESDLLPGTETTHSLEAITRRARQGHRVHT